MKEMIETVQLPCALDVPVRWGYDTHASISDLGGTCIAQVRYLYHESKQTVLGMPVSACSLLRWHSVSREAAIMSEVVVISHLPLVITTGVDQLSIHAKAISVLPVFEYYSSNGDMMFYSKHGLSFLECFSSKGKTIFRMKKLKSTKPDVIVWRLAQTGGVDKIDHRLILGQLAIGQMGAGGGVTG